MPAFPEPLEAAFLFFSLLYSLPPGCNYGFLGILPFDGISRDPRRTLETGGLSDPRRIGRDEVPDGTVPLDDAVFDTVQLAAGLCLLVGEAVA